jgi:predicted permease
MMPFLTFETFYVNKLDLTYLYIFFYTVLLIVILSGVIFIIGKVMRVDRSHLSAMTLGVLFPNSGNYGAPIVLFAYGTEAFDYAIIIMVIHGLINNSLGIFIAAFGGSQSTTIKDALISVLRMPVLYGVLLGVFLQLIHLEIPPTIMEGISLVGAAAIPTVMLILGMQLAEVKYQMFEWKYVNTVLLTRMLISPLLAVVLVSFMPVDDIIKDVFILLAAMPVAANTVMLAVQFNVKADLVSFTTLVTTLVSIITIPLTLYLL